MGEAVADYEFRVTPRSPAMTWGTETHLFPAAVDYEARDRRGIAPGIYARCEMRGGVPEVVELRFSALDDGAPVRTSTLAKLPNLSKLAVSAFRMCAYRRDDPVIEALRAGENPGLLEMADAAGPHSDVEWWQLENDLTTAQETKPRRASSELEEVARVYRDAVDRKPVEAVQFYLGTSYRTAARRVQEARGKGLLPPTTQGKRNA